MSSLLRNDPRLFVSQYSISQWYSQPIHCRHDRNLKLYLPQNECVKILQHHHPPLTLTLIISITSEGDVSKYRKTSRTTTVDAQLICNFIRFVALLSILHNKVNFKNYVAVTFELTLCRTTGIAPCTIYYNSQQVSPTDQMNVLSILLSV